MSDKLELVTVGAHYPELVPESITITLRKRDSIGIDMPIEANLSADDAYDLLAYLQRYLPAKPNHQIGVRRSQ